MMIIISLNSATYNKQILLSQRKYLIILLTSSYNSPQQLYVIALTTKQYTYYLITG